MNKLLDLLKRVFVIRVVVCGEDDNESCRVCCRNLKCAMHSRESFSCNAKNILIGIDGDCKTFIPKDDKHGEFPL